MSKKIGYFEAAFVFLVLAGIAYLGGAKITDCSAALAVFLGFLHSQLSFDLADGRALQGRPLTQRLKKVFMMKEVTWIATFAMLGSWPLLAGAMMFLSYPAIRSITRS